MKYYTHEDAHNKVCPYQSRTAEIRNFNCAGGHCMAWVEQYPKMEREDHSGAKELMCEAAAVRGATVKRTGPLGSTGILSLPAMGFCGRLYPP